MKNSRAGSAEVRINRRWVNLLGAVVCFMLLAYALYAQHGLGMEPCPLCIFQRVAIAALGAAFLAACLQHPRAWGARIYAGLIGIAASAAIGVAARHVYIQMQPPGTVPSCGAPLDVMLEFSALTDVIAKVLTGSGECGEVNWLFLGLSMPTWVMVCAALLGAMGIAVNLYRVP